MILTSPVPRWRDILGKTSKESKPYWDNNMLWTSKSGISIKLIVEAYKRAKGEDKVYIWIPSLFCGETEEYIPTVGTEIIHYPLAESLDPDWEIIKADFKEIPADIFLFVHYFGCFHDPNQSKTFCKTKEAVLIEDCAHALYKYQKIGQTGDFALFSPHKLLGIPDGAIVVCNNNKSDFINEMHNSIKEKLKTEEQNQRRYILWRIKKGIQRIVKRNKPYVYAAEPYYYDHTGEVDTVINCSNFSKRIVESYSYEQFKQYAYIRRENDELVRSIVDSIDKEGVDELTSESECPYFSVYRIRDLEKNKRIAKTLEKNGIPVVSWPELPESIKTSEYSKSTEMISASLIAIPIHQCIKPQIIANKASKICGLTSKTNRFKCEAISKDDEAKARWQKLFNKLKLSNITQDWAYGEVKENADGWCLERYIIKVDQSDVGIIQVLSKKVLGRSIVYRVNKGPILIEDYNNVENELLAMKELYKRIKHPSLFFYVPFSPMSGSSYIKTIQAGWKNWDIYGFPTGTIDLSFSEEELRKNLDSKWRNQLKSSEKYGYELKSGTISFSELLRKYAEEQKDKSFTGVSEKMLIEMSNSVDRPLRIYYVEDDDGNLLAFDIFYRHGKDATYYVGWNSEDGRRKYMNNFLLYHSAIALKNEGVEILDLGGIEYIHTESIAKFKDGLNPVHFRQMGEFYRFG